MSKLQNNYIFEKSEIDLISGLFKKFNIRFRQSLCYDDFKKYVILQQKLSNIQKHTIEWEEFNFLFKILWIFEDILIDFLPKKEFELFLSIADKIRSLPKK
jgi:hypothetical protein